MTKIKKITSHQVLDSGGNWTVDANVLLANGNTASFSVPGGLSRGKYEAVSVSPADAVLQIKKILAPALLGKEAENQKEIDAIIESFNVGANASLAVSVAVFKAINLYISPLTKNPPRMIMLMLEGGKHGDSDMKWQEFSVIVNNFSEGKIIYQKLGEILRRENLDTDVGAEGGYSPNGINDYRALELFGEAAGKTPLALDIADSFSEQQNNWEKILKTNVRLIEDPFGQDDWRRWAEFNKKYGRKTLVVADDLTVTNAKRIALAVEKKAANGVIIKPNQTTTLTKVFEALEVARKAGLKIIISHRGTETNDAFIADLALFVGADYVKFGAPVRGERIAKYNRLLELLEGRIVSRQAG